MGHSALLDIPHVLALATAVHEVLRQAIQTLALAIQTLQLGWTPKLKP